MKRSFLVHGWEGNPDNCWFPWLKAELEKQGFKVIVPALPNPAEPKIDAWVEALSETIGKSDDETYMIGHSVGCQAIMRYLETIDTQVGGVVLVAGFFDLKPESFNEDEDREVARPWLETPINFAKVKSNGNHFTAILSDNDEFVDHEITAPVFEKELGAKVIIEHDKGHFDDVNGVKKLPSILKVIDN